MILVPAYGRDYKTEEEVFNDFWNKELDFRMAGTTAYCSIRDFKAAEQEIAVIRYNGFEETAYIHFNKY